MNTADLYSTSTGFIIHYPFKYIDSEKIGYDGNIYSSVVDEKEPQIFLGKVSGFDEHGKYHDEELHYGNVKFKYDLVTRRLICEAVIHEVPTSFEIPIVTRKQLWEDKNPGPYTTIRISGLRTSINPCASLPYVYHEGRWMLSDPMQIDVITPVSREQEVRSFLSNLKNNCTNDA